MFKPAVAALMAFSSLDGGAWAQTDAPAPQTVMPSKSPTCALPSVTDMVELQDVPDSDLRTVPVDINGTKKQFLLDIGINITEVSKATVVDLHLPDVNNAPTDHMELAPGVDKYKEQTGKANFDMNVTVPGAVMNVKGAK